MLSIHSCTAAYKAAVVFSGLSLNVKPSETAAIIGPSGCGKTTLLSIAAGLKAPEQGSVMLDDMEVASGDPRIGLILQNYGLFPWLSVNENVALGLKIAGVPKAQRKEMVERHLLSVGLSDYGHKYPKELSGGERQRVAIARTLIREPALLLMDEPFSALDAITRENLQELLISLLESRNIITVLVTHSIEEAVFVGTSVYIMSRMIPQALEKVLEKPAIRDRFYRENPLYFSQVSDVRKKFNSLCGI